MMPPSASVRATTSSRGQLRASRPESTGKGSAKVGRTVVSSSATAAKVVKVVVLAVVEVLGLVVVVLVLLVVLLEQLFLLLRLVLVLLDGLVLRKR